MVANNPRGIPPLQTFGALRREVRSLRDAADRARASIRMDCPKIAELELAQLDFLAHKLDVQLAMRARAAASRQLTDDWLTS